jgi:hypothetical protein
MHNDEFIGNDLKQQEFMKMDCSFGWFWKVHDFLHKLQLIYRT